MKLYRYSFDKNTSFVRLFVVTFIMIIEGMTRGLRQAFLINLRAYLDYGYYSSNQAYSNYIKGEKLKYEYRFDKNRYICETSCRTAFIIMTNYRRI